MHIELLASAAEPTDSPLNGSDDPTCCKTCCKTLCAVWRFFGKTVARLCLLFYCFPYSLCYSQLQPPKPLALAGMAKDLADSPWFCYANLLIFLAHPLMYTPIPWPIRAFPPRYCLMMKLTFWGSLLHVVIYIIAVRSDDKLNWYAPTWLLKFLMALWELFGLRRLTGVRKHWDLARFGVLPNVPSTCPPEEIWELWSRAAVNAFRWDCNADVWEVFEPEIFDINSRSAFHGI